MNYLKAAVGLIRTPRFNPMDLITENKSVCGFNISFLFDRIDLIKEISEFLDLQIEAKKISPVATTYFSFDQVAEAHRLIESGKSQGKIVLTL